MRRSLVLSLALTLLTLGAACSSKPSLVGAGGACELATDCASGFICVPQSSGESICSSNLGAVQELPGADAGSDGGTTPTSSGGDAGGSGSTDAGQGPPADSASPSEDTDAGAPPPMVDAGSDASSPPDDGSATAPDAATD